MSLSSDIRDALDVQGWDASVSSVKQRVANVLAAIDESVRLTDTGYFNHSFVPDFILEWPKSRQDLPRDCFLRLDDRPGSLAVDLRAMAGDHPIVLGLDDTIDVDGDESGAQQLRGAAANSNVMLTDAAAIDHLAAETREVSFGKVVPSSLLKGGRGLLDRSEAAAVTEAGRAFFSAAREHDPETVSSAVPPLAQHLQVAQLRRITNFGRIIWDATGGEPMRFPIGTDLSGLDDSGLLFILSEGPKDDNEFWRSVGLQVPLERLIALAPSSSPNLRSFVLANGDRLLARAALVLAGGDELFSDPAWSVRSGSLRLRGTSHEACFAPTREKLPAEDVWAGLGLDQFRERTEGYAVDLVRIRSGADKAVVFEAEGEVDTVTDDIIETVMQGSAVIELVGISVEGKVLDCDFGRRLAGGHTSATFSLMSLCQHGVEMFLAGEDPLIAQEVDLMTRRSVDPRPLSLFDEIEERDVGAGEPGNPSAPR